MSLQTTLAKTIKYAGIGLHSGKNVTITLQPAAADTGIIFVRTDISGMPSVKAEIAHVTNTMRATTLEDGQAKVFTVEHLLSALSAMGVDNCQIEMDAAEPPVADGSALPFVRLIEQAGITELVNTKRKVIAIKEAFAVRRPDKFITILPYDGLRITFTSINPHPLLGVQFGDYEINQDTYLHEIAPARTIGFMKEVAALQAKGLALGGSLENVVVYDQDKVLTPLRFSDELVRHKILDIIGDLSLIGLVRGHVIAVKSSHELNTTLAKKIAESMHNL